MRNSAITYFATMQGFSIFRRVIMSKQGLSCCSKFSMNINNLDKKIGKTCGTQTVKSHYIQMDKDTFEDSHLKHLFDDNSIYNVYNNDNVNMSVGAPGPDMLKYCPDMMSKATEHRLNEEKKNKDFHFFQYGATLGLWECRQEIAKFLSRRYNDTVERKNLFLTCGATHGIQLLLTNILSPNGVIFVEEFTYMIALTVFKQFPFMKIISIPMKDGVVDTDAFETIVAEKKTGNYLLNDEKIFWAMFYTIPTYHNPTGMVIPPESCKRIVDIARAYSILVVCDDVYNLLNYESSFPPRRLFSYDDPMDIGYKGGNIISNGSFSKILSPAIRLGWMECSPRVLHILKKTGILLSGGAVNHYTSGVIASLLHSNDEDEYLDMLIKTYKERLAAVCFALDSYLPKGCSYQRPQGGYFVWICLPTEVKSEHFVTWCQKKYKVSTVPGIRFSYTGLHQNYLRLSIAFYSKEKLMNATETLCKSLDDYIKHEIIDNKIDTDKEDT